MKTTTPKSTHTNDDSQFDVIIVGGGMSGACMALALAALPISIAVVDAVVFDSKTQPSFDDRSVALSYGSSIILQSIGVWENLKDVVTNIEHIHVSDKGHFGFTRLHSDDLNCSALGYVVENRVAGEVFYQALLKQKNITLLAPFEASDFYVENDLAHLVIRDRSDKNKSIESVGKTLSAQLVIAADGTNSRMAQLANVSVFREKYQQMAVILNAATDNPKAGWAYERFTDTGPLALLPLSDNRYSVVWSIDESEKDFYLTMTDHEFLKAFQDRFGFRAGNIKQVGERQAYPLINQKLKQGFSNRLAFVGNALHTSHPVAGQGFNLGLRDIASLTERIASMCCAKEDLGNHALLDDYWQNRRKDIEETQQRIDGLARLFVNQNSVLSIARNLALKWLDVITPAKKIFAHQAMGLRDDLPLLARGVSMAEIISMYSNLSGLQSVANHSLSDESN